MAPARRIALADRFSRWCARRLGEDTDAIEAETRAIVEETIRRLRPRNPERADDLAAYLDGLWGR